MHHALKPVAVAKFSSGVKRDGPPKWPSYTGTSQFVGVSPSGRVTVFVDPSLGPQGVQNANDLVNDADRVVQVNDVLFGMAGGPVSVIIFALYGATDGTGGADHMSCDYVNGAAIEVCAAFGQSERVSGLFEAELSECSMGGNLCGETCEALCGGALRLQAATPWRISRRCRPGRRTACRTTSIKRTRPIKTPTARMRNGVPLLAHEPGPKSKRDRAGDGVPERRRHIGATLR